MFFIFTYEQALDYIWGTPSPGEDRAVYLAALLNELGNPHLGLKYVHVAGTNGKGSTCAFVYNILRAAGHRTGFYISPHIDRINERIEVNGEQISDDTLSELTYKVSQAVEQIARKGVRRPSIFGIITAIAYLYFKQQNCDIVVLETGMGGRLDATNLIESSEVSAITNIGLDHTEFLGTTLAQIAEEKAGIIKDSGRVVLYSQSAEVEAIIEETCKRKCAVLTCADGNNAQIKKLDIDGTVFDYGAYINLAIALPGVYQVRNAVTAIKIAEILAARGWNTDEYALRNGLKNTRWPGRFELLCRNPVIIVDGTHNPQGTLALMESLDVLFAGRKINFVIGVLADKDYSASIELAAPYAKRFYAVSPPGYRALGADELAEKIEKYAVSVSPYKSIPEALDAVLRDTFSDDVICVFGTLYQVAEIKAFLNEKLAQ